MYFSKIRKSLPAAAILAVLLLGGAATDAAAFSVEVDSLYYNDASSPIGHNLEYFSETGYVVDNVVKNGVSPNSFTALITYDWGVPPLSSGDLALLLDKSFQIKNFPFVRLSTALRGRAVLSWSESEAPGQAPAVNLDNHIQLYTVKLANFADLSQGGDSTIIIGLGRDDVPSSYQAAVRITWQNGEVAGTYDLTLQAVVKNEQGTFRSSDPITHPGLVLSAPAATPAETTMTVTLSVDSPNNFTAAVWTYSPRFSSSADQFDTFLCPAPVPEQIYRSPDFLSFVDLETANAGTIQLSASSYSVSENYGSLTITATRRGGSKGPVEVSYATSDGTAIAGSDYTAASGTLSWADGDTASKTFTVPIANDGDVSAETFTVTLSNPMGGALGIPASAAVTIITPTVQFQSGSSSGNEATTPAVFTVILPAPSAQEVRVDYATADGTAKDGVGESGAGIPDYTATSGTLTFLPGETSKTISVPIINDPAMEGSETFTVTLSNPSNATLGTPTIHTYTITEPTVQFQSGPSAGPEYETPAVFIVTLSAPSLQTVTVNYATADGTATAGVDYTAKSGTLTFAPSDTFKQIEVLIKDDTIYTGNRDFTVTLSSPTGGVTLGTPAIKTVTIIDDETKPPTVQFQSGSSSGNEATTPAVFTVTLSAIPTLTVTVSYATADGTATAGSDYTSTSGVLTFIPGFPNQTSQTIAVPIIYNAAVEGSETFTVTLLAASNATLGTPTTHTYTIVEQGYPKGDVNNDGKIDAGDAILVLRYSVGLVTLTAVQKEAGNVTSKASNNNIDSGDAIKILRYSVGLIKTL